MQDIETTELDSIQEVPSARIRVPNLEEGNFSLDSIVSKVYDNTPDECIENGEHFEYTNADGTCVNCGSADTFEDDEDSFLYDDD